MDEAPNQGAQGDVAVDDATTADSAAGAAPSGADEPINQGATGAAPHGLGDESGGESPLSAHAAAESGGRPEIAVASAFVGGFAVAQILRWLGSK